ncbi:MAG: hypothetical protein QOJ86_217 [Bradyrhizobium sp.]|nr:hypothetical protein [Bradyrhizobium sp.]
MAAIISFPNVRNVRTSSDDRPNVSPEVVVFPRTSIRVLGKLWGLPQHDSPVAGRDGRGESGDHILAGQPLL